MQPSIETTQRLETIAYGWIFVLAGLGLAAAAALLCATPWGVLP